MSFYLQYADPVTDLLDKWDVFRYRLFRESCVMYKSNYVKDLSRLGRELHNILIVDNSPASYIFHPENAVSHSNVLPRAGMCLCCSRTSLFDEQKANVVMFLKVPVASWFDDMDDRELLDLIPFLEKLSATDDIYAMLQKGHKPSANGAETTTPAHAHAAGSNPIIASVAR